MDQEKFEAQSKENRVKNTDALTAEMLAIMLKADIPMFSTHYIQNRTLQVVEETINKLNFKNGAIMKARRAFLDVLIDGMQVHPFTIEDEIVLQKKAVDEACNPTPPVLFDKEKKEKALGRLQYLERVRDGKPEDATEERDVECEPICQQAAKTILSKEWLLKDEEYVNGAIEFDDDLLIRINAMNYANELFKQVYDSLDESYKMASEKLWGTPRTKIRLSQMDNLLTKKE